MGPEQDLSAALDEIEPLPRFDLAGASVRADLAVARAHELGLTELALRAQVVQADILGRRGRLAECGRLAQAVNRWAAENGHAYLLARSHYVLEGFYRDIGDYALSLEHAVRALELLDETAPATIRFDHLARLADALSVRGDYAAARERYQPLLALGESLDLDRRLLVLNNLAYNEVLDGDFARGLDIANELTRVADANGIRVHAGRLDTVARALMGLGRFAEAEQILLPVLDADSLAQAPDGDTTAEVLLTLAEVQRELGATDRAQASLDTVFRVSEESGYVAVAVRAREQQAELHARAGNFAAAYREHKIFHQEVVALQSAARDARALTLQAVFEASEAREQSQLYRELSLRDSLTGMYNRRFVDQEMPGLVERHQGDGVLVVALLDLDHFKRVNDTFSHHMGDEVLRVIGKLLNDSAERLTGGDIALGFAARLGGEEFLLVFEAETQDASLLRLEELATGIRTHPWRPLTGELGVTASIGAATRTSGQAHATMSELLQRADDALYTAKHTGRDRVVVDATGTVPTNRRSSRGALPAPAADPSLPRQGHSMDRADGSAWIV